MIVISRMMKRKHRLYLAIWLTLGLVFQSVLMPYARTSEASIEDSSLSYWSNNSILDQSHVVLIHASTDLTGPFSFEQFSIKGFILSHKELLYGHIANQVKTLFLCYRHIDLLFSIKELKFPSHYFW